VNSTLPTEQDQGQAANSRKFNVPALMGIGKTAPFFHENSAATLTDAVRFYDSNFFNGSPGAAQVGGIGGVVNGTNAANIAAFLSVVGEEPEQPTITGVASNQAQTSLSAIAPFANVTIADATVPAQTLTVTVALDQAARGNLANLGAFTLTAPGTWQFSGIASAATTALRSLTYAHAPSRTPVGLTELTRFTIGVNDGIAATVFNDATTVISTTMAVPMLSSMSHVTSLNTSASLPTSFSIAGLNTSAADFVLTASSSDQAIIPDADLKLGGTGADRTVSFTPLGDSTGTVTITITASQGGQSISQTFTATVVPFLARFEPNIPVTSIQFTTTPGQIYAVEMSDNLSAINWLIVAKVIATQTTTSCALPQSSNATRAFYRVRPAP
jgi:hypothetical protein